MLVFESLYIQACSAIMELTSSWMSSVKKKVTSSNLVRIQCNGSTTKLSTKKVSEGRLRRRRRRQRRVSTSTRLPKHKRLQKLFAQPDNYFVIAKQVAPFRKIKAKEIVKIATG